MGNTENMSYMGFLLFLLGFHSSLSAPCNETRVTAGDTWVNISWSLHCEMNTTDLVSHYHLLLTDNTAGIYDQDTNQYCMERECSFLFTLARPCIQYTIHLQLIGLEDDASYNYTDNEVTIDEEPVSAPRLLKSTGSSTESISLSWYPPVTGEYCVKEYQVCASSTARIAASTCATASNIIMKDIQKYTLHDVLPCLEYIVTVTPVSEAGPGLSESVLAETEDDDPGEPDQLSVNDMGYDYIELEWVKPETNRQCIKGVGVFCVETKNSPTTASTTLAPTMNPPSVSPSRQKRETSLSAVSSLEACRDYTCWVAYPDTAGSMTLLSDAVRQSTWVKGVVISEPSNVARMVGKDFMQVSWGAPSQYSQCVDSYILTWSDVDGWKDSTSVTVSADTFSYTIDSLRPCAEYQVDVRAFSSSWGQNKTGDSYTFTKETKVETPGPVTVIDLEKIRVTADSFTV